jgi:hypothetical protein
MLIVLLSMKLPKIQGGQRSEKQFFDRPESLGLLSVVAAVGAARPLPDGQNWAIDPGAAVE